MRKIIQLICLARLSGPGSAGVPPASLVRRQETRRRDGGASRDARIFRAILCLTLVAAVVSPIHSEIGGLLPPPAPTVRADVSPATGMARTPDGVYRPFFRSPGDPKEIPVKAFQL